jgi:hypothetical protein
MTRPALPPSKAAGPASAPPEQAYELCQGLVVAGPPLQQLGEVEEGAIQVLLGGSEGVESGLAVKKFGVSRVGFKDLGARGQVMCVSKQPPLISTTAFCHHHQPPHPLCFPSHPNLRPPTLTPPPPPTPPSCTPFPNFSMSHPHHLSPTWWNMISASMEAASSLSGSDRSRATHWAWGWRECG